MSIINAWHKLLMPNIGMVEAITEPNFKPYWSSPITFVLFHQLTVAIFYVFLKKRDKFNKLDCS